MSENANQSFAPDLDASGLRFAIVVSRFNSFITDRLLTGAMEALTQCGAEANAVDVVRIPGRLNFRWQCGQWRRSAGTTRSSAWAR